MRPKADIVIAQNRIHNAGSRGNNRLSSHALTLNIVKIHQLTN